MPWAVSLSLGDNNSFWTQAQHLRIISWFIWSDITLFVCQICHWIVKQKKELFFLSKTGEKRKRNFAEALKLFLNDNTTTTTTTAALPPQQVFTTHLVSCKIRYYCQLWQNAICNKNKKDFENHWKAALPILDV